MWMFSRPLDALTEGDLDWLIANKVRETRTLDYKRQMYGDSTDEKRKMLRDVASMANAEGGVLVLGMDQDKDGAARELVPVPNAGVEADRLIKICNAFIAERIIGLRAPLVAARGGAVIVVYVPRSYRTPHMVTLDGRTDFWTRHDNGNGPMSISEMKTAVTSAEDLEMKLDRYIEQRRNRIAIQAGLRPLLAIMATPLSIASGRVAVNGPELKQLLRTADVKTAGPIPLTAGLDGIPTLDGRLVRQDRWSLETFRTGHVELIVFDLSVVCFPPEQARGKTNVLWGALLVEFLFRVYDFVTRLAQISSIADPYVVTMNFWNIGGFPLSGNTWDEPTLFVGPVAVDLEEGLDSGLRRIADLIWNAFGIEQCPCFDGSGKLKRSG